MLLEYREDERGILIMDARLQHYMNPMHIYCRLRDLGLDKSQAIHLSRAYEWAIFKAFARAGKP
jgi:hypothetical protein